MDNKVEEIKHFCAKCYKDYGEDVQVCPVCCNELIKKTIIWNLDGHGYF